ncbi:MAG: transcriptional regulator [Eubacterium sp.]|jgi:Lrp/AsnC family leucine-responsive transcriptional regulator|nr:transcriptional regulator [Eubacterium sp.]
MDLIDLEIINILKQNSRKPSSEISKRINLSLPATSERIRKLEESGIIEQFTVKISREKFNYHILAFIFVGIDNIDCVERFNKAVIENDTVLECHQIAGEYDYLLKVTSIDTKQLEHFILNFLKKDIGVARTNTIFSFSSIKENMNI